MRRLFVILGDETVSWLAEESLRRYLKLVKNSEAKGHVHTVREVRMTKGGAIIDPEDIIKDIADDNSFISVGKNRKTYAVRELSFSSFFSPMSVLSAYSFIFIGRNKEEKLNIFLFLCVRSRIDMLLYKFYYS